MEVLPVDDLLDVVVVVAEVVAVFLLLFCFISVAINLDTSAIFLAISGPSTTRPNKVQVDFISSAECAQSVEIVLIVPQSFILLF